MTTMVFRKAILGATAAVSLSGVALAADLPSRVAAPMAPVMAPAWSWTGFYAGLRGSYGFAGEDRWGIANRRGMLNRDAGDVGIRGGQIGLFGGYNLHLNASPIVLGVEGDINFIRMSKSFRNASVTPFGLAMTGRSSNEWTGSLRMRVGYAFDRVLVYGTGGVAFAGNKYSATLGNNFAVWSKNETLVGWTIGAGVDYALTDSIFAGVEYRYTGFPKDKVWDTTGTYSTNRTPSYHSVALRLGMKF